MRGELLVVVAALFAGTCSAQTPVMTPPAVQDVRSSATETWACNWTDLTDVLGPGNRHIKGRSEVQVVGSTIYWELPAPTVSGWVLMPHLLIEDDELALVAVVSATPKDLPSWSLRPVPVGAAVFLIDKASGHFRMGSVMGGGNHDLMDGHCERKSPPVPK